MDYEILALPSPDEGYVALSRTRSGRLLRKKILPMNGSFVHPADHKTKIYVDKNMAESLVKNFNSLDFPVQVPIVNKDNQHTEDPRDNSGEVVGLEYDDSGVYATIDARKFSEDFGKTILGASAFLHLNYMDTASGERVGPTLLHVAATNRPHINGLGEFEELLKFSADINSEDKILFMREEESAPSEEISVEETPSESTEAPEPESDQSTESIEIMTKEEMLAALKEEHGIDVEALQSEATRAAELSSQLDDVNNQLKLSGEKEIQVSDLANALVELSNSNKGLASKISTLEAANETYAQRDAENEVDALVRAGKVLPAQRDVMVKLSRSDRETFDALIPENPIVKLSVEEGYTVHEEATSSEKKAQLVADYVARAQAQKNGK